MRNSSHFPPLLFAVSAAALLHVTPNAYALTVSTDGSFHKDGGDEIVWLPSHLPVEVVVHTGGEDGFLDPTSTDWPLWLSDLDRASLEWSNSPLSSMSGQSDFAFTSIASDSAIVSSTVDNTIPPFVPHPQLGQVRVYLITDQTQQTTNATSAAIVNNLCRGNALAFHVQACFIPQISSHMGQTSLTGGRLIVDTGLPFQFGDQSLPTYLPTSWQTSGLTLPPLDGQPR